MIQTRLNRVYADVHACEHAAGRPIGSVKVLAVSKKQSVEAIREAYAAGQKAFGENYCQEALAKIEALKGLDIEWHFIGDIQSNKTQNIATHFDWVQGISRLKIAERLSAQRPVDLSPLNVCIQVNIDNEPTKAGVLEGEALPLAKKIASLPQIKLRGLMVLPAPLSDVTIVQRAFRRAVRLHKQLNDAGLHVDTLSMGMSSDYVLAIEEGTTMIRVGTAIFGSREKQP